MLAIFFYFFAIILELIFAITFALVTSSFIYSSLKGSPYVPTKAKEIEKILKGSNAKAGKLFFELGCGDGRIARYAASHFKLKALGVDVNPFLIWYARFLTRLQKLKNVTFIRKNIFDTDLRQADIVYLFLMPELISKLVPKMEKEIKKSAVVISHGFTIVEWKSKLYKKIEGKPFSTFYYRKS